MTEPTSAPPTPVDQDAFRDVIGRFASGVTVITTLADGVRFGTTASAVSSLSVDPPMLLICMNKTSETGQAIHAAGRFVVNILGEDQADLARRFATKGEDKFDAVALEPGLADVPMIAKALGHLECVVAEVAEGGTHTVFLAHVEHARAGEGNPLTYYRGRFGRFEDAAQEAAYQQLRELVLTRAHHADASLEVEALAAEHDLDPARVQYALVKLATDGLVVRDPERGYVVRPLDVRAATEAIDARCTIEVAIADEVAGRLDPADATELRAQAAAACRAVEQDPPDYEQLRTAGRAFHRTFVGLTGNGTLVDLYGRLRLEMIWARLLKRSYLSPTYLTELAEACVSGDVEHAKRAIRGHAAEARRVVEATISAAGGAI